jgi:hypothetical protein
MANPMPRDAAISDEAVSCSSLATDLGAMMKHKLLKYPLDKEKAAMTTVNPASLPTSTGRCIRGCALHSIINGTNAKRSTDSVTDQIRQWFGCF